MTIDQFWKLDKQAQSAIRRGDKLRREYLARKTKEYAEIYAARVLRLRAVTEKG